MDRLPPPLPRNPRTARLHRRDLAWQIYLPIGLALAGALVAAGLAIWAGSSGQAAADSTWADVSLILLILIAIVMALAPLALVAALVVGLWYALRYLPGYARVAQDYLLQAARIARQAADRAAAPILVVESATAAVRGGWKKVVERKAKR